jgi:hypothetical protein
LKIQQKTVSNETSDAIQQLIGWLAQLSKNFKDYEEDILEIE